VQQIVSRVLFAQKQQARLIIVPYENLAEAQLVRDAVVVGVQTLHEVLDILQNESIILDQVILTETAEADKVKIVDFADIIGQEKAKRVLEIAIAGRHHVMLSGPPGSGKSLLAQAAASILPTLTYHEQLEVQQIYELTQQHKVLSDRPVRQPHHTISQTAFVGGGVRPQPGEMSLAHHGILFLDEIMEFPRTILETLRQPLEEKAIRIHRNRGSCTFPANFMLIGACNPCPCGYVSDTTHECNCSAAQIHRYQKKLSGPLLERFDMYCEVERIPITQINKKQQQETSKDVQERVQAAQELQKKRYATETITFNGEINAAQIKQYITLKPAAQAFFDEAATRLRLSMRVYHRILKVAQTIADLEQSATIYVQHIAEAFQYREHYLLTNQ
jgi:magnesium chelatase family protein